MAAAKAAAAASAAGKAARGTDTGGGGGGGGVRDLSLEDWCGFEVGDETTPFRGSVHGPPSFESLECLFDDVTTSFWDGDTFSNNYPW